MIKKLSFIFIFFFLLFFASPIITWAFTPLTIPPLKSVLVYPYKWIQKTGWSYDQIIVDIKEIGFTSIIVINYGCSQYDGTPFPNASGCTEAYYRTFVKELERASEINHIFIIPTLPTYGYQDRLDNLSEAITQIDFLIHPNVIGFYYPSEEGIYRWDAITVTIREHLNSRNLFLLQMPYDLYQDTDQRGYPLTDRNAFDVATLQNGTRRYPRNIFNLQQMVSWIQPGAEGGVQIEDRPSIDGDVYSFVQNTYDQLFLLKQYPQKHMNFYFYEAIAQAPLSRTIIKQWLQGDLYHMTYVPSVPAQNQTVTYNIKGNPLTEGVWKMEIYIDNALKQSCTPPFTVCQFSERYLQTGEHSYFAKIYDGAYKGPVVITTSVQKVTVVAFSTPTLIPGDIFPVGNHDGKVDGDDFNQLKSDFGKTNTTSDINKDGKVNIFDYNILVEHFDKNTDGYLACLPPNIKSDSVVSIGIGRANKVTVSQKLDQLQAHCDRSGKLIDSAGKEIYFFPTTGCWGNPPADYQEILHQQQENIDHLKQTYDVIEMTCNPEGLMIQ